MYTGSESYFNIEFKNIVSGYIIYDGIWIGWCADSELLLKLMNGIKDIYIVFITLLIDMV